MALPRRSQADQTRGAYVPLLIQKAFMLSSKDLSPWLNEMPFHDEVPWPDELLEEFPVDAGHSIESAAALTGSDLFEDCEFPDEKKSSQPDIAIDTSRENVSVERSVVGSSNDSVSRRSESSNRAQKEPTFPVKLHLILSDPANAGIVSWLPHGRSWRIVNQQEFVQNVIPRYFRHGRYASFARQVNGWGFKRIIKGDNYNSYYHEMFLRDNPKLSQEMRRLTTKDKQNRTDNTSGDQAVPDWSARSSSNPRNSSSSQSVARGQVARPASILVRPKVRNEERTTSPEAGDQPPISASLKMESRTSLDDSKNDLCDFCDLPADRVRLLSQQQEEPDNIFPFSLSPSDTHHNQDLALKFLEGLDDEYASESHAEASESYTNNLSGEI